MPARGRVEERAARTVDADATRATARDLYRAKATPGARG